MAETTLVLWKILWPLLFFITLWALLHFKLFSKMLTDLENNKLVSLFISIIRLIIGLTVVALHNVWTLDYSIIVTVVGWLLVIIWATGVLVPGWMMKQLPSWHKHTGWLKTTLIIFLLLWLALCYVGFCL